MKIHDLHPPKGSVTRRTRVGRGIAAGKGKTAGRGTKGQRSRAGASIPAWFEGGQTPLHIRIPKLRGFRNINDIEYEVVNVGAISAAVAAGRLEAPKGAPVTVNADTLKQAGLVRRDRLPLKILGQGDVNAKLFVLADAFTRSARTKIEAAGGTAQVIEVPSSPLAALGVEVPAAADEAAAEALAEPVATPAADEAPADEAAADKPASKRARKPATRKAAAKKPASEAEAAAADDAVAADEGAADAEPTADTEGAAGQPDDADQG
jgi:large subunit ribosomal protein L15